MFWVSSNEVDEPSAYHTVKSEKQILYTNAYIWNLERWYWWIYLQGNNGDSDIDKRLTNMGVEAGRRGWNKWREYSGNIYILHFTICKIYSQREFAVWLRELNLEGWDGVGGGRGNQERGTYVYLWLIHVDIWQKPTQYCKESILQLKMHKFFKKKTYRMRENI